jgi:predicted acetyltransferase
MKNLMVLYQYDFAELGGDPVDRRGEFHYKYFDSYWEDSSRYPFLIFADDELAGFTLVNSHSQLGNSNIHAIAEFFILRYLRGQQIGLLAAKKVLAMFPGDWEVSQTYQNTGAQKFWLKVVASITKDFERADLPKDHKIVLKFKS